MARKLPAQGGMKRTTVLALFVTTVSYAATLSPETIKAWEQYTEEKIALTKLSVEGAALVSDDGGDSWTWLRSGRILVAPAASDIPKRVPSGLIHDWVATEFIPNATIPDVFAAIRDYDHYKDVYRPAVIDSKLGSSANDGDHFSLRLMNKSAFVKSAVEGDYHTSYFRVNDHKWYSISESTRIQEIERCGGDGERRLPEGEGTGLIWRVRSITVLEERDGGVLMQLDAMVLSRDIPGTLRWFVDPIVRRVSKESLHLSLQQTRDAVQSNLARAVLTN